MSTLAEIEAAIRGLSSQELIELEKFVQAERRKAAFSQAHSVLDIPPASVGRFLRPFSADDDLLGEMLEALEGPHIPWNKETIDSIRREALSDE